jgi:hypothetical protein
MIFHVKLPPPNKTNLSTNNNKKISLLDIPPSVGWEKNFQGKLAPNYINLSNTMDPLKLAENAVDLNVKLMTWRVAPNLPFEEISKKKALLIGAGTLGCAVSRSLLVLKKKNENEKKNHTSKNRHGVCVT